MSTTAEIIVINNNKQFEVYATNDDFNHTTGANLLAWMLKNKESLLQFLDIVYTNGFNIYGGLCPINEKKQDKLKGIFDLSKSGFIDADIYSNINSPFGITSINYNDLKTKSKYEVDSNMSFDYYSYVIDYDNEVFRMFNNEGFEIIRLTFNDFNNSETIRNSLVKIECCDLALENYLNTLEALENGFANFSFKDMFEASLIIFNGSYSKEQVYSHIRSKSLLKEVA